MISKRKGMVAYSCNPSIGRLRKEDQMLQDSLGHIAISCLKNK
jgi:hypothetical protein